MTPLFALSVIFGVAGTLLILVDVIVIEGFFSNKKGVAELRRILCPVAAVLVTFSLLFAAIHCFTGK